MDYETVTANDFGASLQGMGVNILVRDVRAHCTMLETVFGMSTHRVTDDFAILRYGADVFQLHADRTYSQNPYLSLLPENPPRGAGIELRLYDSDPDKAADLAERYGMTILQRPTDKPHGLREAYLLCPDGYAWVPSCPI